MKKFNYLIFTIFCSLFFICGVSAAPSAKLTVSSSNIYDGKTVTASVTVYNTAAWNIKITSSGNTNGCTQTWADATSSGNNTTKTFTTTCRANSTGIISFNLSGDVTSSDGSNSNVSGTSRVTVSEPKPASEVNTLKSLSIDSYELSPEFTSDTLEYTLTVPSTVNSIKINATKKDSSSTITGDGEHEVSEGSNKFDIIVTAESGATRTYSINVTVEDTNPIKRTINGVDYTIIKNSKNLTIPTSYIESTINIDNTDVPCFINDINHLTLIAMKDQSGTIKYYVYDNDTLTEYVELTSMSLIIMPESIDPNQFKSWHNTEITINNNQVDALQYKNQTNYYLIYGMDISTGNSNYYLYDSLNNTYQIFNQDLYNSLNDDLNFYLYMLCGAIILILICIIIIISLLSKHKQNKKVTKSAKEQPVEEEPKLSKKELKKLAKDDKHLEESNEETYNILNDD